MAKKVFKYVCELGCEILRIMLERYDEAMRMEKIDLISTNLAERIAMLAAEASYRVTEETISETYGQSISHAGTWNLIQQLGGAEQQADRRRSGRQGTDVSAVGTALWRLDASGFHKERQSANDHLT